MKKILSFIVAALFSVALFADTYTVVGVSAICGSDWKYDDATNDMSLVSGTSYQLVKTNLTLAAGTYNFKVCVNHSYATEYPSGYGNNANVAIAASGIYKITFTFDASSHNVGATPEKTGDAVVVPNMSVKGGWDGWTEHAMAKAANNETASVSINITSASTFEFGLNKDGNFIASGATLTRESTSSVVTSNVSNMKLTADVAGEYTFTWTYATNTLAVTYPAAGGGGGGGSSTGFYLTGDSAFVVDAGGTADKKWNSDAIKVDKDTAVLNLKAMEYKMKITVDGQWATAKGYSDLTEKATGLWKGDENNICFYPKQAGEVKVVYNGTVFKLIGTFDETKVPATPTLENGYYLIGQTGWDESKLSASLKFAQTETAGEYKLDVTLVKDQEIKVVEVEDNAIKTWYPDGVGNAYKVDEAHAGAVSVYFRPAANDEWKTFHEGGFFFITEGQGGGGTPDPQFDGKFYITGDAALVTEAKAWDPKAIEATNGTYTFSALAIGDYKLKITVDGTWATAKGFSDLASRPKGVNADNDNNICFSLAVAGDVKVSFDGSKITLEGTFDESKEITITDGYYLIGQTGWSIAALNANLKFAETATAGEYKLDVTLAENQELKVVAVENSTIKTWYPDGVDNAYKVDAAHAGAKTIYFRPAGNEEWKDFGGFIFIEASQQAIGNTADGVKAVKVLRDGQLLIIKGEKTYTIIGAELR